MAQKVITLPHNYANSNYSTDRSSLGFDNTNYTDTTIIADDKNAFYSIFNGSPLTSDSKAGSDIARSGNGYSNNKSNGIYSGRYGKYNSTYLVGNGIPGLLTSGVINPDNNKSGWQPNVNGLCWMYNCSGAHSAKHSSYPTRIVLLYAREDGMCWRIEAKQKIFGVTLGTTVSSQNTNYWTGYQVLSSESNLIKDNNLLFGGFIFQMYSNHGSGSQELTSNLWNIRPTIYKDNSWNIGSVFSNTSPRQVIYNKNNLLNSTGRSKLLETQ